MFQTKSVEKIKSHSVFNKSVPKVVPFMK